LEVQYINALFKIIVSGTTGLIHTLGLVWYKQLILEERNEYQNI